MRLATAMVWLEILGGARRVPHGLLQSRWFPVALGFWWALLILLSVAFIGRSTKFIYVDF
jgi:hypothetical protein